MRRQWSLLLPVSEPELSCWEVVSGKCIVELLAKFATGVYAGLMCVGICWAYVRYVSVEF